MRGLPTRFAAGSNPAISAHSLTADLRAWFDADMARTGRELLSKLQFAHPEAYPDGLLRTVQRRL